MFLLLYASRMEETGTNSDNLLEREQAVLAGERRILEMIATGVDWQRVLNAICGLFEAQNEHVRATILLVRNHATVHPGAAPSLPDAYDQQAVG